MLASKSISKTISILFLLLIITTLVAPNAMSFDKRKIENAFQPITKNAPQEQDDKDHTVISEKLSLEAIVNVSLQWNFDKIFHFTPSFSVVYTPIKIPTLVSEVIISLLPYFQNLFAAYIVVNAP